ncbi:MULTISPECIES: hypothetical protein [Burkholderiaceae]|uniref:Uncharacterized protein n=1 Tax=Paraburkholderia azotifigens TaxID=2057004 RepID=A0ABU9QWQ2_9BURK|nr:hypothetical protein [Burkholderia sp. SRS-W-2-2016]OLL33754.1 hypothetical protein BTH42_00310 [Burkholderia sp. SRS-W-2-2016]
MALLPERRELPPPAGLLGQKHLSDLAWTPEASMLKGERTFFNNWQCTELAGETSSAMVTIGWSPKQTVELAVPLVHLKRTR